MLLVSHLLALLSYPVVQQTGHDRILRVEGHPDEGPTHGNQPPPPRIWYSGDTHEHLQSCNGYARPLQDILDRMVAENLDLATVLIWDPQDGDGYTRFICLVTGAKDPISTPQQLLQFGIETSGLDCDKWGHLSALGIGPEQARIAHGELGLGDCADMNGLGLGCTPGDGTGALAAPVAEHFYTTPGAVCGYAHSLWPVAMYRTNGYDWNANLVERGLATDIRCTAPSQFLAIPNLAKLLEDPPTSASLLHGDLQRAFFPLLGAVDAVLGEAQYFETTSLRPVFPLPFLPTSNWYGLYYKLLSAGLRVSISGGSDEACPLVGATEFPRTYVWLDEPFSYQAWIRGLAAGHTSIGVPGVRIDLRVKDAHPGEEVRLPSEEIAASVDVEVESAAALTDCVELMIGGQVYASLPVTLGSAGTAQVSFGGVPFPESTWAAARLCSQRAHTAAVYVISGGRPIGDCATDEYWMLWCDIVAELALDSPQLGLFECQTGEALARIAKARRAFKSYRDLEGFDPAWTVARYGLSSEACRGPIAIGTTGPARIGQSLMLTCLAAPPLANGVVYLSRARADTCDGDVRLLVRTDPGHLLGTFPVQSTRSGYAEVLIPTVTDDEPVLYAQFVWTNPPGCSGVPCGNGSGARSASDGLSLTVQAPVLTAIEVTPTNPSIALGTSQPFTAMGIYDDGSTQDLTTAVTWSSTDTGVATISNAPPNQGLAASVAVGVTTIRATDPGSGVVGATSLTVTPAVLVAVQVTPTNPSIALGTSRQFTAMGIYSDATKQDVTEAVTWSSTDPGVATVSNAAGSQGLATSVAVGSTTIRALDPGSGISGASTLTVTPAVLVALEVTPTNPTIPLGTSQQFTAMGVYSDATTQDLTTSVTWSSSSPGVATVSNAPGSNGLATSVSVGSTSIGALEPGSGISGSTTLTVTPAVLVTLEVTPTNPSIPLGTSQQFTAMGIYSDASTQDLTASVTWSSSSPGVATVSNAPGGNGLATSVSVGSTTIGGLEPGSGISGATTLTVTPAILVALEVTPANSSIPLGTSRQFTAMGIYSDATTQDLTASVTWTSSSLGVATVSNAPGSEGLATSVSVGVTTIRAQDPGSGILGETTLEITPAELVSLAVTPLAPSIPLGTSVQFAATGTYTDATTQDLTASVTWSSSSPAVATVSNAPGSQGLATSVALGVTTIRAEDPASGIGGETTLTVTPAVLVSITVTPSGPSIALGTSQAFFALGTYTDGSVQDLTTVVTWNSTDAGVATISNAPGTQGLATSLAVGVTTITATDPETAVTGSTTLTVTPAVLVFLDVQPHAPSIPLGTAQQFTAIGTYTDATTQDLTGAVTWSSTEPGVATISNAPGSQGLATSAAVGETTIQAVDPASGVVGSTTLTVTPPVLVALAVTPVAPTIGLGTSAQFTATGTYTDGSTQDLTTAVGWSSTVPAVATISNAPGSQGLASGVSVGTTTIRATDPGTGLTGETTLTVKAVLISITVTPVNPAIAKGATKQFTATGSFNDGTTQNLTSTVVWSSSKPAVATVSNSPGSQGLATGVSGGTATISATDSASGVSGSTTLRVLGQG